jgi:aminopeptidase
LLEGINLDSLPLVFAVYKQALLSGANSVDYVITLDDLDRQLHEIGNERQLNSSTDWELLRMKEMDVYIGIRARTNGLVFNNLPLGAINARRRIHGIILNERVRNTRWCITRVPTNYDSGLAGMSTQEYVEYFFNAVLQDYELIKRKNKLLKELMSKTDLVHIVAPRTDIMFSIKGIEAESCHGDCNIPDGEVFTCPIWNSVNGRINYNVGTIYNGQNYSNVSFMVVDGRIISADCDQGKRKINNLLDTDDCSRYFGEFAIGTNKGIIKPIMNTIFDEKIFGSFHLTPGSSHSNHPDCNESNIHMDLVRIMTSDYGGGCIEFDGVPVIIDGRFVHPDLLSLND